MKIQLGQTFKLDSDPIPSIDIEGYGTIEFNSPDEEDAFEHVILTRKQMLNIKKAIEKELDRTRDEEL
jgi:hypothetical protein